MSQADPLSTCSGRNGDAGSVPHSVSLSPSLQRDSVSSKSVAYEVKFIIKPEQAVEAEERLIRALLPDPHSDPALQGMYAITSLACDTPRLGVFHRDVSLRYRKYRVRRYGASSAVYLERKRSRQGKVRKRRVEATVADLEAIAARRADDVSHSWFVNEIAAEDLSPVCRIRYLRRAMFGVSPEGPMRVTFDRHIQGSLAKGWSLEAGGPELPLLQGQVICEFKFQVSMPTTLKAVMSAMKLEATGISKYRACVRAFAEELGVDPGGNGGAGGASEVACA
jgi:hypothetical protein